MELDAPDLGRRRLEHGDGSAGVDVEDADVAVERHRGGERAGGVGREGDNPERVPARGGAHGGEVVRAPDADGLVERTGEEQRRGAVVGGGRPHCRPDGFIVGAVHRLEPRQLHVARFERRRGGRRGGGTLGRRANQSGAVRERESLWPGGNEGFRSFLFFVFSIYSAHN
jgi:hypothetical protein